MKSEGKPAPKPLSNRTQTSTLHRNKKMHRDPPVAQFLPKMFGCMVLKKKTIHQQSREPNWFPVKTCHELLKCISTYMTQDEELAENAYQSRKQYSIRVQRLFPHA